MGEKHALQGQRIGIGSEAASAITNMAAEVKSSPGVHSLKNWSLERHVSGAGCSLRECEPYARKQITPGSSAVHNVPWMFLRFIILNKLCGLISTRKMRRSNTYEEL
jgi:hypothetical protein